MKLFQNASIRKKITSIILIVTIISLIGGFSIEIIYNIRSYKKDLINSIALDAKLISDYAVPTILFDDNKGATGILEKLNNIPSILHAVIFDSDGSVFAEYYKKGQLDISGFHPSDSTAINKSNLIHITVPILSENEKIGKVNIVASTAIIRVKTLDHIKSIFFLFVLTSLIAVSLANVLGRIISRPIIDLSLATRKIQYSGDFSLKVKKKSDDEIGKLYDSFNDLLISLEARKAERDKAESALLQERENLEIKVKERTLKLDAAKIKAEESDKLKSSFLANMSHEIRTPLNAIIGFTEFLTEGMHSPDEKKFALDCVYDSKDDLIQLIENVLDTSSLETSQFSLNNADVFLNNEIASAIDQTKELLIRKNKESIEFITNLSPTDNLKIYTDSRRIIRVLKQLIDNAIKYTDKGIIEVGTFIPQPNEIGFYVKDTGCGIPEEEKDKVFNSFYKVETNINRLYRGAGLGLTLTRGIINSFNGKIWLESEINIGTTFNFTIPVSRSIEEFEDKAVKYEIDTSIFTGKKILIVEDKNTNYAYLSYVLKKYGMISVNAVNGFESVDLVRNNRFDLVLMDILMPKMDGFEAARQIKLLNPNIPIIAQTAFNFSNEDQNLIDLFDDYLIKPILPDSLLNTLAKFFNKST